jgi:CRISPR-associated exonuclease Cas4
VNEEDYLPLSAVERFAFCKRQAYLFHTELLRADNRFTIEGTLLHRRVTTAADESRPGVRIARSVRVVSHRLGVFGVADVVEFHESRPHPVEYKRGRRRARRCEHVQVCLQAACLEEMLGVEIPAGSIYHARSRRREEVPFTDSLRAEVESLAHDVHEVLARPQAPPAVEGRWCRSCSLVHHCQPHVTQKVASATAYLKRAFS